METLLLVEDDKLIRQTLREVLEREGFLVVEASVGKRSVEIIQCHQIDLILLDLKLPDVDGLALVEEIRSHSDVPLLIVSGEQEIATKLNGLELGADDYIEKPFEMEELVARIRVNLRRYHAQQAPVNQNIGCENFQFSNWTLDMKQYQIFDENGRSGELTAQEFQILEALIMNAGCVLRRSDLCEVVREDNYTPTARAIDVKIARIRKKIGDCGDDPHIIKTVRGVGYIFCQSCQ